ncbi:MAG TPA: hypothetical protein VIM64_11525 [Puia sp.]
MREGLDLVYKFQYVVQATENKLLPGFQTLNQEMQVINCRYGRPAEINAEIQELSLGTNSRYQKFPLIAMFEPLTIVHPSTGEYSFARGVEIIIAMPSESGWDSYQRQQRNVDPYLIPIYQEFMRQLGKHPGIVCRDPKKDLPHTVTIHKGGKLFNDLIDCIEIKDLTIKFKFSNC